MHGYLKEHNFSQYLKVVQQILESDNKVLRQSVIQDLIQFLSNCSEEKQSDAWRNIAYLENSLEYHGYLWDIAPPGYKQKVIREKYAEFFTLIEEFKNSGYPYSQYISINYKELYDFDRNDQELAKKWGNNTNSDFVKAKMLSARGAEKLVQYFYRNLGSDVEDIAAHQISNKSELWRQADICVNEGKSRKLIDIKNARQNVNSSVYSEFCVPTFKQKRGEDVVIAAVLSPDLQLQYMNKSGANFPIDNPKYLGELSHSQLQSLTQSFIDSVIRLDMTRGFDPKKYLPPWLFDYNKQFYLQQINIATKFRSLHQDKVPFFTDLMALEDKAIDYYLILFIYANKPIPLSWQQNIPQWKRRLIVLLYRKDENSSLNLPHIFMAILKHFLEMLSINDGSYHPNQIICLLKYSQTHNNRRFEQDLVHPLKIYDPLNIIANFCTTLEVVWDNRELANLSGFKIFKFHGKGYLIGKRSERGEEIKILVYCGGKIKERANKACGKSPLILGREKICPICKNLICVGTPKIYCGFCSYEDWDKKILCQGAIQRQNEHRQRLNSRRNTQQYPDFSDIDF